MPCVCPATSCAEAGAGNQRHAAIQRKETRFCKRKAFAGAVEMVLDAYAASGSIGLLMAFVSLKAQQLIDTDFLLRLPLAVGRYSSNATGIIQPAQ